MKSRTSIGGGGASSSGSMPSNYALSNLDSFSADAALPYRGFAQTLFDIAALIFLALFLGITALSILLSPLFILFCEL